MIRFLIFKLMKKGPSDFYSFLISREQEKTVHWTVRTFVFLGAKKKWSTGPFFYSTLNKYG